MKTAQKPTPAKAPARRSAAAQAMADRGLTRRSGVPTSTGIVAKTQPLRALKVIVEVDPLLDVVRRHVHLTPSLAKVIKGDFVRLFQNPALAPAAATAKPEPTADTDPVISTQEAADLVGVSRPYLVARIEAGDIPLHQQAAYASLGYHTGDLPITEQLAQRIVSLPMYPDMSLEAADYVSAAILKWVEGRVLSLRR